MSDKDIVSAVRANLADKIGRDRFDVWFGPATRLTFDGKALVVEAASKFSRDWLRTHYRRQIEAACGTAAGSAVAVEFRVDESLTAQQRRSSASQPCHAPPHPAGHAQPEPAIASPASIRLHRAAAGAAIAEPYPKHAVSGNTPKNAADQISRRRFATLESFVVGQTNRLAQASAQMVAERPGSLTPLLIYGPPGCGKTHLLEGVFSSTRRRPQSLNAVYLAAEQFTTLFVEALRGSGLPSFRRKYRGVDLLIIDDLQFLVRARATRIELLHTIDALAREGRQLVFSADRPPAELSELGPELTTRLAGGMVCKMEPPDLHTRVGLVHHFARRLDIELPDDVARYVAAQITAGAGNLRRRQSSARRRTHVQSRDRPAVGRRIAGRLHSPRHPRRTAGRHRKGRVRCVRPADRKSANQPPHEEREHAADVGHVAGAKAHPRGVVGNRPIFRPPQPQHGDLGSKARRRPAGQANASRSFRSPLRDGRSHPPRGRKAPRGLVHKRYFTRCM